MIDLGNTQIPQEWLEEILTRLTTEEKVSMVHGAGLFRTSGVSRLAIPSLIMSDGPMGVRKEHENDSWTPKGFSNDLVSYLPSNMGVAATWSEELAYRFGSALGRESRGRGKDIILAPGINIIRSPLGGRNFEYMSEDPLLISRLVVPLIRGIQDQGVGACVKHFAVNNHEHNRLEISVEVDERTLREIYFPGFKAAVQEARVYTLMSAYNRLRGEFCSHNSWLLKTILREEWGFDGVVISDWGAVHDTRLAATSGLDIEMDVHTNFHKHFLGDAYLNEIKRGNLDEKDLNAKVRNILRLLFRLGKLENTQGGTGDGVHCTGDNDTTPKKTRNPGSFNNPATWQDALDVARASVVVLKNDQHILPLDPDSHEPILVIGENADKTHALGGGSAEIRALFEMSPLLGLTMIAGGNRELEFVPGYSSSPDVSEEERSKLREQAITKAQNWSGPILFIGGLNHDHDAEGSDRKSLDLPYEQDILIESLLSVHRNLVIINVSGSPVAMPWVEKAQGIIQMFYAGMFGGQGLAEVIFGRTEPSGRLPVSFPKSLGESPAHTLGEWPGDTHITYTEGLNIGYRYFSTHGVQPLFPFGHGLTYTRFGYDSLKIENTNGVSVEVSLELKNSGDREGTEVVQVYVEDLDLERQRPRLELRDFKRVTLQPREVQKITFQIEPRSLEYFDTTVKKMIPGQGKYGVHIGASSGDIRLSGGFSFT